jgi:hypothetical protein
MMCFFFNSQKKQQRKQNKTMKINHVAIKVMAM